MPIATATDGGGSIRIPAAFYGLVGIKPTHGVVARRPIPDWIDLSTDGALATIPLVIVVNNNRSLNQEIPPHGRCL